RPGRVSAVTSKRSRRRASATSSQAQPPSQKPGTRMIGGGVEGRSSVMVLPVAGSIGPSSRPYLPASVRNRTSGRRRPRLHDEDLAQRGGERVRLAGAAVLAAQEAAVAA